MLLFNLCHPWLTRNLLATRKLFLYYGLFNAVQSKPSLSPSTFVISILLHCNKQDIKDIVFSTLSFLHSQFIFFEISQKNIASCRQTHYQYNKVIFTENNNHGWHSNCVSILRSIFFNQKESFLKLVEYQLTPLSI